MLVAEHTKINLLIASCKKEKSVESEETIATILQYSEESQEDMIHLAYYHGVLPLLYKSIKHHQTLYGLSILKQNYQKIARNNMLMSMELIKTIDLFKQKNISALAFKGPALAQIAYSDITLRQFGDLDILIHQKDIDSVIELLEERHYILDIEMQEQEREKILSTLNVIGLKHSEKNIRIEIHWRLTARNYAISWDDSKIWERYDEVIIHKQAIPTLSFDNHLLYLCVHGAKHLYERLEWLCDIDCMLRTKPAISWEEIILSAERLKVLRILLLTLGLCETILDLELSDRVKKEMNKDISLVKLQEKIIALSFTDKIQKPTGYQKFILLYSMRDSLYERLSFVYFSLFTPKFDDYKMFQLPKYLSALYPILRVFRLGKKYLFT